MYISIIRISQNYLASDESKYVIYIMHQSIYFFFSVTLIYFIMYSRKTLQAYIQIAQGRLWLFGAWFLNTKPSLVGAAQLDKTILTVQ